MKSTFIFLTLLFASAISLSAQNSYYWHQSEKVILTEDRSVSYFNTKNLKLEDRAFLLKQINNLASATSVDAMSDHEFIIRSTESEISKLTINKNYHAYLYKTKQQAPVIILPSIIIRLVDNERLDKLLPLYRGKLKLIAEKGYNTFKLECNMPTGYEILKTANELKENHKEVLWCEPEFYGGYKTSTVDPLYPQQYYLKNTGQFGGTYGVDINIENAWANYGMGNASIRVAVIDQGVESHEDLGTLLPGLTAGNGTGNGAPENGAKSHGMAVAGIIAARHNTLGIAGIAPNVQILPINIFPLAPTLGNQGGSATSLQIADAIDWAWNQGQADILSCSWNGGAPSNNISDAITRARNLGRNSCGTAKGCVVVFSSGNENNSFSGVVYPANLNGVMTVGAISNKGVIHDYSSRGSQMELVAPSGATEGNVRTLDRMGGLGDETGNYTNRFNGTSAACPQVSGVAALILSVNPNLTELQVRDILTSSAKDMGSPGFDNTYGFGRLNAYYALHDAASAISGPSILCSSATYSLIGMPSGASITWSVSGNIEISGPSNGTSANIVKTGNGRGNVQAVVTSGCNNFPTYALTKNIIVGSPLPTEDGFLIDDDGDYELDQTVYYTQSQTVYINLYNTAYNYYNWSDFYWNGNVSWYHQAGTDGIVIEFQNPSYGDYVGFDLSASNSCGTNNSPLFIYYEGGSNYNYRASPNPASNSITVTPTMSEESRAKIPRQIAEKMPLFPSIVKMEMIDKMGHKVIRTSVKENNLPSKIDVSRLKTDVYTLLLFLDNGRTEVHKIVIN